MPWREWPGRFGQPPIPTASSSSSTTAWRPSRRSDTSTSTSSPSGPTRPSHRRRRQKWFPTRGGSRWRRRSAHTGELEARTTSRHIHRRPRVHDDAPMVWLLTQCWTPCVYTPRRDIIERPPLSSSTLVQDGGRDQVLHCPRPKGPQSNER